MSFHQCGEYPGFPPSPGIQLDSWWLMLVFSPIGFTPPPATPLPEPAVNMLWSQRSSLGFPCIIQFLRPDLPGGLADALKHLLLADACVERDREETGDTELAR